MPDYVWFEQIIFTDERRTEILAAAHHLREDLGMEFVPQLLLRLIGEGK